MDHEYLGRKTQAVDYFDAEESGNENEEPSTMDDDQVDPLDAFMQGIDAQVMQQRTAPPKQVVDKPQVLNFDNDDADSYLEQYARV